MYEKITEKMNTVKMLRQLDEYDLNQILLKQLLNYNRQVS